MLPTPRLELSVALRERVRPATLASLARRIRRAARRLGLDPAQLGSLGLRIVDDAEMARLHVEYMGEAGPTDVLSFPPSIDVGDEPGAPLGDIALDWDAVERQARGPTIAAHLDEATVLVVHGLAHLLGHDHRERGERRRMQAVERRVLRALGVDDPRSA